METELVSETLAVLNNLMWLSGQEDFIAFCTFGLMHLWSRLIPNRMLLIIIISTSRVVTVFQFKLWHFCEFRLVKFSPNSLIWIIN